MRSPVLALVVLALGSGAAQARGHGFAGGHVRVSHPGKTSRAAGEGHRHRSGIGEVGTVGPSSFHPVKRWKGFSYLQHEKHPEKED